MSRRRRVGTTRCSSCAACSGCYGGGAGPRADRFDEVAAALRRVNRRCGSPRLSSRAQTNPSANWLVPQGAPGVPRPPTLVDLSGRATGDRVLAQSVCATRQDTYIMAQPIVKCSVQHSHAALRILASAASRGSNYAKYRPAGLADGGGAARATVIRGCQQWPAPAAAARHTQTCKNPPRR